MAAPYHHGNLRETLLDDAEALLEQGGELSLRELARRAGVSHGAPRQHFADKRALLDALATRGFTRLGAQLDDAVHGARRRRFAGQLTEFTRAWVGFATRHPALLDLMFTGKNRTATGELRQVADHAFATSTAMITTARDRGDLIAGDPDRVAMTIFAMVQGLAALITSGMHDGRDVDHLVTGTVDTLMHGLRPRQQ